MYFELMAAWERNYPPNTETDAWKTPVWGILLDRYHAEVFKLEITSIINGNDKIGTISRSRNLSVFDRIDNPLPIRVVPSDDLPLVFDYILQAVNDQCVQWSEEYWQCKAQAFRNDARRRQMEASTYPRVVQTHDIREEQATQQAQARVTLLDGALALEAAAKEQLRLEIQTLAQVLTEARTDSERLPDQLMEQLTNMEDLSQDLAGRIGMIEKAYSQLRVEARDLKANLETAQEESRLAKMAVALHRMRLQGGSGSGAAGSAEGSNPLQEQEQQQQSHKSEIQTDDNTFSPNEAESNTGVMAPVPPAAATSGSHPEAASCTSQHASSRVASFFTRVKACLSALAGCLNRQVDGLSWPNVAPFFY
ncbi:hypothetical protein VaNZ11_009516 [Volvox africanus]|uniref:Uncharacterized protein n=1 Tax=Volvox africanus TaxID=51714 RepID=A0ABQ5S7X5_9CHLO|nr:hypothetical protein VaNZ11_009516 [Volvox africanus]